MRRCTPSPAAALLRVVPVVLPGRSHRELPSWLNPGPRTFYTVTEVSIEGSRALYGYLTGQVDRDAVEPPVGSVVALDAAPAGAAVHTAVRLEAAFEGDDLVCSVRLDGVELSCARGPVPDAVGRAWSGQVVGPLVAAERMMAAGAALATSLFDQVSGPMVADLVQRLAVDAWLDVVLVAGDRALGLPVELVRLTTSSGVNLGPVAIRPGVTVRREVAGAGGGAPASAMPGPLKVLAAVAAPEESTSAHEHAVGRRGRDAGGVGRRPLAAHGGR